MKYSIAIYAVLLAFILFLLSPRVHACPKTVIDNRTKVWNDRDRKTLARAQKRCGELFADAPCLKIFIKKDATTYNAICGGDIK